jgi:predicted dienelactone hydrolase
MSKIASAWRRLPFLRVALPAITAFALAAVLAVACGGGKDEAPSATATPTVATATRTAVTATRTAVTATPTVATATPTAVTATPTAIPTTAPTVEPTVAPTTAPTVEPTIAPTPVTQNPAESGPFAVGVSTLTLVDESRPTDANGDYPGATSRTLVTEVWYPAEGGPQPGELRDAPLDRSQAPYPLIVFSHGLTGNRRQSSSYTAHLASHGYVVISPDFPLSTGDAPGGPRIGDAVNQPGDVSFLIDRFLQFSNEPGNLFESAIDETAIGLTGHSTGGLTAILATFGPLADPRVKATLPLAPMGCMVGSQAYAASHIPLLVIGGSADQVVGFPSIRQAYDAANTPKYLLTLLGGNHMRFAEIDIEDPASGSLSSGPNFLTDVMRIGQVTNADLGTCLASQNSGAPAAQSLAPDRQRELTRLFATAFFDYYLKDDAGASSFLTTEFAQTIPEVQLEIGQP